ncbi:MAG: group III truncated hemoglobin [Cyclobacteriaceae bacterium]
MPLNDIESRADIELLLDRFYTKVRVHETLGPFFNETIDDWGIHLAKIADFWESNLFFIAKFKGNPMRTHIEVDQAFNHSIEQAHFGLWLQLWTETMDENFEGEKAHLAKERARNMAQMMFLRIYQARKQKGII